MNNILEYSSTFHSKKPTYLPYAVPESVNRRKDCSAQEFCSDYRTHAASYMDAGRGYQLETHKRQGEAKRGNLSSIISTTMKLKSLAWPLEKYPLTTHFASGPGTLQLPRYYLSEADCDRLKFWKSDNLNSLTYEHYKAIVDLTTYSGSNFVTNDEVQPKRHEYLGPSPKVAGYCFTQKVAEIAFWDDHLNTMWIGNCPWDVELVFDPVVENWFVKEYNWE